MPKLRTRLPGCDTATVLLLLMMIPAAVTANDAILRPPRVVDAPRVDGWIDESVWTDAAVAGSFVQQRPEISVAPDLSAFNSNGWHYFPIFLKLYFYNYIHILFYELFLSLSHS